MLGHDREYLVHEECTYIYIPRIIIQKRFTKIIWLYGTVFFSFCITVSKMTTRLSLEQRKVAWMDVYESSTIIHNKYQALTAICHRYYPFTGFMQSSSRPACCYWLQRKQRSTTFRPITC